MLSLQTQKISTHNVAVSVVKPCVPSSDLLTALVTRMHKFYWHNTHGPGAAEHGHYRLGKSGSADNILSEVSTE